MKPYISIDQENELAKTALNICFKIHSLYGPGLYESVYEEIFSYELIKHQLSFERQKPIPLVYEELKMNIGFRADVIIENKLIVELKSVDAISDIHLKQVQTYLKLSDTKLGLLINFNTVHLKDGIKRLINTF